MTLAEIKKFMGGFIQDERPGNAYILIILPCGSWERDAEWITSADLTDAKNMIIEIAEILKTEKPEADQS